MENLLFRFVIKYKEKVMNAVILGMLIVFICGLILIYPYLPSYFGQNEVTIFFMAVVSVVFLGAVEVLRK